MQMTPRSVYPALVSLLSIYHSLLDISKWMFWDKMGQNRTHYFSSKAHSSSEHPFVSRGHNHPSSYSDSLPPWCHLCSHSSYVSNLLSNLIPPHLSFFLTCSASYRHPSQHLSIWTISTASTLVCVSHMTLLPISPPHHYQTNFPKV